MTRKYEIVYIFDSALEEAQINETLGTLQELLTTSNAPNPVTASSHWGKRTLAYEVAGKNVGYYVVTRFETDPSALTEFERRIKLEDRILRYLIVVDEGLKPLLGPGESDADATDDAKPDAPVKAAAAEGSDA